MIIKGMRVQRTEVELEVTPTETWQSLRTELLRLHSIKPDWFLKSDGWFWAEDEHCHGSITESKHFIATPEQTEVWAVIQKMDEQMKRFSVRTKPASEKALCSEISLDLKSSPARRDIAFMILDPDGRESERHISIEWEKTWTTGRALRLAAGIPKDWDICEIDGSVIEETREGYELPGIDKLFFLVGPKKTKETPQLNTVSVCSACSVWNETRRLGGSVKRSANEFVATNHLGEEKRFSQDSADSDGFVAATRWAASSVSGDRIAAGQWWTEFGLSLNENMLDSSVSPKPAMS